VLQSTVSASEPTRAINHLQQIATGMHKTRFFERRNRKILLCRRHPLPRPYSVGKTSHQLYCMLAICTICVAEAETTTIVDTAAASEEGKNELLHELFIGFCISSVISSRLSHANTISPRLIT